MQEVEIRRATVADSERLAEVYRSAYQENRRLGFPAKAGSVTSDTVSNWIRNDRLYVASVRTEIVGGVRLEETDPDRVKLSRLGVHADWKGSGVGSRLLDHVETLARDQGFATVWLTTPGEHPYLPELYRRRGYEKTGEYPLDYRDYDEIVMEKRVGSEDRRT
ncbi:GNAT family N-acetyltransferase [Natronobacterium lacisalsi]|uniref:GNAT family N-acetyltransferase n=1 Tax=Natronobacterium lacisalsi TaxID=229731 RepID=UPI001EE71133|nr:GNAT family N-acetyltransferase [Halobiforma lacisalsi]